jgi:bifunctional NMN adenylyltransferase/nudix hydrolase
MRAVEQEADVGVVIGRFQTHELTAGHIELLTEVEKRHPKVIVLLGLSPLMVTTRNPLDFESRKQMIAEQFPDFTILYVKDIPGNDRAWSESLDQIVGDNLTPTQSAMLYGSRDSFVPSYVGRYPTRELEATTYVSASEVRKQLRRKVKPSGDWRAGVVWASANQFPKAITTVDVAVFNDDWTQLLLARKKHEELYRFIGGFSTPESACFEADARREVQEEAQIEITDPQYVGSCRVDDLRYRGEADQIKTLLFKAKLLYGRPSPADDIVECRWFEWDLIRLDNVSIVPTHRPLMEMLRKHMNRSNDGV